MRNFVGTALLSVGFLFLTLSAQALEKLEKIPGVWGTTADFGTDGDWVILQRRDSQIEKTQIRRTVTALPGGGTKVEATGDRIHTLSFFRPNGTLTSSEQTNDKLGVQLKISVNGDRSKATYQVHTKDKDQLHEVGLSPNHLLTPEIPLAMAAVWQTRVRDGASFKSFSPDGANEADMEFKFIETTRPTGITDKFDFPSEFKAALPPTETYVVGEMYLTGIAAMFYPHHMHFVFKKIGTKLEMVAYFGGDPAKAEYQYRTK